jgi:hypothetical protein
VTRRTVLAFICAAGLGAGLWFGAPRARGLAELPERLADRAFWNLVVDASEPGGYFRSQDVTNLTSNELGFQLVIPELIRRTTAGGVYLGVGPEQNFTYIAAVRPKMAIIVDIRRGNLGMQLLYKAVFEMSADRADFVAMLFARPRPRGVGPASTAAELFRALDETEPSETLYREHLTAIEHRLLRIHRFPLRPSDLAAIRTIYQTLYYSGVAVRPYPTYADLMTATDPEGVARGFLESEESFTFLKDLESRNLVIPVVGDFAGPKAIRAIGAYLKASGGTVSAFYLSNVEQYLYQDGKWDAFCRNAATLPLDSTSTFIRSGNSGGFGFGRGGGFVSSLGSMAEETQYCSQAPR